MKKQPTLMWSILTKWHFWVIVILLSLYKSLSFPDIFYFIGIFLAEFLTWGLIYLLIYGIIFKIFKKKK